MTPLVVGVFSERAWIPPCKRDEERTTVGDSKSAGVIPSGAVFQAEGGISAHTQSRSSGDPSARW